MRTFIRLITAVLVLAASTVASVAGPASAAETPVPDDPLFEAETGLGQWSLQQINAPDAWQLTTGDRATIAIVDSGIDLDHEDLADNVVAGNTFTNCGDEGCGNGDWESGSGEPSQHGTHVAGIAAAVTNNGIGVAGTAPDAKLLAVKVSTSVPVIEAPCFGDGFHDIALGITWAVDNGADVINLSLGNPVPGADPACQELEPEIAEAIAYANDNDVVVVAAAGNSSEALCSGPPGSAPGALCVAATDSHELPAEYSNRPVKSDELAVAAPGGGSADYSLSCGGGVLSTVPAGTGNESISSTCGYPDSLAYDELIGTSMASPHVAGVAALLRAQGCTRVETLDLLTATARHPQTGARGSYSPDYGFGIVDAAAAASAAADTCTPLVDLAPTAVDDQAATPEDQDVVIDVLANDTDPEGSALTISSVEAPAHGTASAQQRTITYSPDADYAGPDTFGYTITDEAGNTASATVTVTVTPVNDAPIAVDDATSTRPNSTVTVTVTANDTDIDGDALTVAAVEPPANGTATITADGAVVYQPANGFKGVDRFGYTVTDGNGGSAMAEITVTVSGNGHWN